MKTLIRRDLINFKGYACAQSQQFEGEVWLNANEMPEGDINSSLKWNRYSQNEPVSLLEALAAYYQRSQNQLKVLRGSNEGINLLIRLFCTANKDNIIICPPTYGMYSFYAKLQGVAVKEVPLDGTNFQINIEGIEEIRTDKTKIIFICSPNNPTGSVSSIHAIATLCEAVKGQAIVVIDQAYIEFSDIEANVLELIDQYENCVVLRTLSKGLGMAALRLGVVCANSDLITWLSKIASPYCLPQPSVNEAVKSLSASNLEKTYAGIKLILDERRRMTAALLDFNVVERVINSQANFILVKFCKPVYKKLVEQGIIVRDRSKLMKGENWIRITIGTQSDNYRLLKGLERL